MDFDFVKKTACVRPKVTDEYAFNENQQQIIGRGSYGVVYKVRKKDETNVRFYALKVVELTPYSPSTCREISIYRETNHRNIMKLLKIFFDHSSRKAWLLFDYAEYDLHSVIKYYRNLNQIHTRMPDAMAKSCLWQILHGVKYLHDNWILHRDLKPENILVMGDGPERGCIKITDMGMARTFHSPLKPFTEVDAVVVTCWYRAPELFLGSRHYTKAIDMFSVGCIFAELLTNMPIFNCAQEQASQQNRTPYQFNQLDKMFSILGYPTLKEWDDLRQMPMFAALQKEFNKSRYTGCKLAKYMKNFNITPKQPSFVLLTKLLTMDPKRRITSIDAIEDIYLKNTPQPLADVFNCFTGDIPFPLRQHLPAKKPISSSVAVATATASVIRSSPPQNNKLSNSNGATASSQMQFICKPITSMPVTNMKKFC